MGGSVVLVVLLLPRGLYGLLEMLMGAKAKAGMAAAENDD
jgi:hypothetical protein